ncbi:MAG: hypothetical protein NC310_00820 [Roseburia sp.]|nr:hypothetical protein [Anaeroplasma bactoclasticum]MCM1195595.1 hypothetical protein [Roseburia sp.]MCM1556185.1 hypothetical protein [Anaeroplasma bactoclasticum]
MKKIMLFILMIFCFCVVGCDAKEVPAEIILVDENQEAVTYQISATDNLDEVKEIFNKLNKVNINSNFNGFSLDFKTELEGKVVVTNQETRTIDLGYTFAVNAITNLKKFKMSGTISLDGYTNTDSDSLSLKTKNKLSLDLVTDDMYAFLKGNVETGDNHFTIKDKVNIYEDIKEYKPSISSYIDLMKYYNPLSFISNPSSFIDTYHVIICKTTKDSFTLRLQIPANLIFKDLDTDLTTDVDIELSCANLLPIHIEFQADDAISLILENEYIRQYLTSTVQVENAKLKVDLNLKYDYFEVLELTEEEKETYRKIVSKDDK